METPSKEPVVAREDVQRFYGKAGDSPDENLCCPTIYSKEDISHIPKEVMEVSYGCGSPVTLASIREGETLLDLGSGGGVDCFIASRLVGKSGKVIGIDMTPEMMNRAKKNADKVAHKLGFKNVEFRHGFLEDVPVRDEVADVITSNCVVNLSPNKKKVMEEVKRCLKDGGRFVISDIVSESPVPQKMQKDKELWGECISGALTEQEFVNVSKEAGFYGMEVLKKTFFREVEGHKFWSVTLQGWKFNKGPKCVYIGQKATYLGPYSKISDDEGHTFERGLPIEVCTDTAQKLSQEPYKGQFTVTDPTKSSVNADSCCTTNGKTKSACC